jgi:radical SAM-linked protein
VDAESGIASERSPRPIAEPRQRWRLVFRRPPGAPAVTHRELVETWLERLSASGLPLPQAEGNRPRSPLTFAAPLPMGMAAERELADLLLSQRLTVHEVRQRLLPTLPESIELLSLHDVWLGLAPLAACLAATDYRVRVGGDFSMSELERSAQELLQAESVPRQRMRGTTQVNYDLRPLVGDIVIDVLGRHDPRPEPIDVLIRTLFDPTRGAGRPEEVVAELAQRSNRSISIEVIVRERVLLADELDQL